MERIPTLIQFSYCIVKIFTPKEFVIDICFFLEKNIEQNNNYKHTSFEGVTCFKINEVSQHVKYKIVYASNACRKNEYLHQVIKEMLIKYNKYVHCSLKHMAWLFRKNFQH